MNEGNPVCSANLRPDSGKCDKNTEDPPNTFEQVKAHCNEGGKDIFLEWWDDDVYFNNAECDILDRNNPGPAPPHSESVIVPDTLIYENCGPGTILQDGVCVVALKQESVDALGKWETPYPKLLPNYFRVSCSFDGEIIMWFYQFIVNLLCEIDIKIMPDYECNCGF